MAMANNKTSKALVASGNEEREVRIDDNRLDGTRDSIETSVAVLNNNNSSISSNAPKYGTVIPNRVFVGGISTATTEHDLAQLFSNYGNVTETKIISDRAGVSKGYGFVTFETEDEARRLQRDAENIVLRERRLNIAPAVKKQGFGGRNVYEGQMSPGSPLPLTATGVYKQNGIPYTFHNGMAYFPPPAPAPTPQLAPVPASPHMETPQVYQTGGSYSTIPQGGTSFSFPYPPQGQMFYPPHPYQYHVPYDGCYEGPMMVPDGVMVPQYYTLATPQPPEVAYYQTQPAPISVQQEGLQPVIYASPRTYDSSAIIYSEPTKPSFENGLSTPLPHKDEAGDANRKASVNCNTPVVSVLNLNKDKIKEDQQQPQLPPQHHYHQQQQQQFYSNRGKGNVKHFQQYHMQPQPQRYICSGGRRGGRGMLVENMGVSRKQGGSRGRSSPPPAAPFSPCISSSQTPVQVPQFPFYSNRPVYNPTSFYPTQSSSRPLSRSYFQRSRYNGGGRGRGMKVNTKDLGGGDELGTSQLTPPITPRSPRSSSDTLNTTTASTPPPQPAEHLTSSMQALAI